MTDRDKASKQITGPRETDRVEKINFKHQTMNTSRYFTKKKKKDVFVYRKGQKEKYLSKKIIRALDKIDNIWKSFTKGGR